MQSSWFVFSGEMVNPKRRLFCFPYGGAGSGAFRKWGKALPPGWQLCAIVPPGRERRFLEPRFEAVGPLVEALTLEITPLLDRPFAFFGHSVGALEGFELARILRRKGLALPDVMFMSGRSAPQCPRRAEDLRLLSGDTLVVAVQRLCHPADSLPDPAMIKAVEPLLRSDFSITETYVYTSDAPFDQPITVFGATEDATVTVPEMLDWRMQTTSTFTFKLFTGGHFFIDTHFEEIIRMIAAQPEAP